MSLLLLWAFLFGCEKRQERKRAQCSVNAEKSLLWWYESYMYDMGIFMYVANNGHGSKKLFKFWECKYQFYIFDKKHESTENKLRATEFVPIIFLSHFF